MASPRDAKARSRTVDSTMNALQSHWTALSSLLAPRSPDRDVGEVFIAPDTKHSCAANQVGDSQSKNWQIRCIFHVQRVFACNNPLRAKPFLRTCPEYNEKSFFAHDCPIQLAESVMHKRTYLSLQPADRSFLILRACPASKRILLCSGNRHLLNFASPFSR